MNLKKARLEKKVTQAEVASFLGITRAAYTNIENGNREADYKTLSKLSSYFDASIDYLIGSEEKKEPAADDGDKLNPNTVVFCDKDGERQVLQYSEEQMQKLNRILSSTKKESLSEYEEIIDRINQLSPSNLSKLSELIDLYLNAQDSKE